VFSEVFFHGYFAILYSMKFIHKYFPAILLGIYVIEATLLGISPHDRAVWYAENIPIMGIVVFLVVLYIFKVRFSNLAYFFISILPFLHTIGGYYTFELVPFDWFNHFFEFERNMFDRVGHFTAGFLAYGLMEYVYRYKKVSSKFWAFFMAVCFIGTLAMTYELIEWQYAVKEGGSAGAAFLGSQGDVWDAQKDMLMDTLGAIFVSLIGLFTIKK
jgi:putative membrane protein